MSGNKKTSKKSSSDTGSSSTSSGGSSSSSSSSSAKTSTGPVNWADHKEYYEYLKELRSKEHPDSWATDLEAVRQKFPGVNFTIDGIQTYYKKQQDYERIAKPSPSESETEAMAELVRTQLQTEIKELTKEINALEEKRTIKAAALDLHNKKYNK
jgi:DNA-binding transcriptional MerR regulator